MGKLQVSSQGLVYVGDDNIAKPLSEMTDEEQKSLGIPKMISEAKIQSGIPLGSEPTTKESMMTTLGTLKESSPLTAGQSGVGSTEYAKPSWAQSPVTEPTLLPKQETEGGAIQKPTLLPGGVGEMPEFQQALTGAIKNARQQAQLQGRPLTRKEISSIVEGHAKGATERLSDAKKIELSKQIAYDSLEESRKQFNAQMEENQRQFNQGTINEFELQARNADLSAWLQDQEKQVNELALGVQYDLGLRGVSVDTALLQSQKDAAQSGSAIGGAALGYAVGGVPGAIIGGVGGYLSEECIIISACTSPYSKEVCLARAYRDKFMDDTTLAGYYKLSRYLVPVIQRNRIARRFTKTQLVDCLIDFGCVALMYKTRTARIRSEIVARTFLLLCYLIGKRLSDEESTVIRLIHAWPK